MMARIYPDSDKTRVVFASAAEEQFYQQAKLTLGSAWQVYYSCTLSTIEEEGQGLRDNEIDFVCYHPQYGVVVVEVKGGRIRHDATAGAYYSVNRHGESFEIKDPFQQALMWKSRFLRFLRKQNVKVPVSHAVAFPSVAEEEFPFSAAHAPEIIIGRTRLKDLERALKTIAEISQPEQYRSFDDVGPALDRLLVGSTFTTKMYLRDYLDSHENRLKDVEAIHETLITPIASSKRLGVEGEAGTGKTMLALMLAKHFRDQGHSVLLLGSNGLLNLLLQKDLGKGIDVHTYPELANSFGINLLIPPSEFSGQKEDWVQYEAPERLKSAIAASARRYNVMICDEAQDVQPFWWEAFESLLDQSPEQQEMSRFYLFFDSSQGVFGSGDGHRQFVASETLPIRPPYFPLVHNYRTTREIATFARAFRTSAGVLESHCGRLGYVPELVIYKDAEDAKRLLGKLVHKLTREEMLDNNDITILSARNPSARESVLFENGGHIPEIVKTPLYRLTATQKRSWRDAKAPREAIGLATIAGFKGMETNVGILLNVSEYNLPVDNPIMASLIYVACTRAKHMLYVFVRADDPKRQAFEAALTAIRANGTLVLEGSRSDFEFSGKVVHYNPDRVGWLKVDDPDFQQDGQGSVMFFPHDVQKAALSDIKVGMKLKFRSRIEGQVTIACDLVLAQIS